MAHLEYILSTAVIEQGSQVQYVITIKGVTAGHVEISGLYPHYLFLQNQKTRVPFAHDPNFTSRAINVFMHDNFSEKGNPWNNAYQNTL